MTWQTAKRTSVQIIISLLLSPILVLCKIYQSNKSMAEIDPFHVPIKFAND